MSRRLQRSVVAFTAMVGLAGALAAFEACGLDQNGLLSSSGGSDASFDGPLLMDATVDSTLADSGTFDARDARSDGPDACAPIETDCLDGIDNDCNGLTDCADPACSAGYACVAPATGGFAGYAIYESDRASACPPAYPTQIDTYEVLISTPASCSACGCNAVGASCGGATLTCSAGATCSVDGGVRVGVGAGCSEVEGGITAGPTASCEVSPPVVTAGTCVPEGGVPDAAAVSFGTLSRVCSATRGPGGGCSGGAVCVARPPSGSQGVCVSMPISGAAQCPTGYASAHATMPNATSFDDTRGCSPCSCTGPADAGCVGAATLYAGAACGGGEDAAGSSITLAADGVCRGIGSLAPPGVSLSSALDAGVGSQGTCAPSGGEAVGMVTPTHETLYCCQN